MKTSKKVPFGFVQEDGRDGDATVSNGGSRKNSSKVNHFTNVPCYPGEGDHHTSVAAAAGAEKSIGVKCPITKGLTISTSFRYIQHIALLSSWQRATWWRWKNTRKYMTSKARWFGRKTICRVFNIFHIVIYPVRAKDTR